MLDIVSIQDAITPAVVARGLVLEKVKISKDLEVTLTIAGVDRPVSMDDCVAINRRFTELFDQDEEDYSLTVTSPGVKKQKDTI